MGSFRRQLAGERARHLLVRHLRPLAQSAQDLEPRIALRPLYRGVDWPNFGRAGSPDDHLGTTCSHISTTIDIVYYLYFHVDIDDEHQQAAKRREPNDDNHPAVHDDHHDYDPPANNHDHNHNTTDHYDYDPPADNDHHHYDYGPASPATIRIGHYHDDGRSRGQR